MLFSLQIRRIWASQHRMADLHHRGILVIHVDRPQLTLSTFHLPRFSLGSFSPASYLHPHRWTPSSRGHKFLKLRFEAPPGKVRFG